MKKRMICAVLALCMCLSLAAFGTRRANAAGNEKVTVYMPSPAGLADKLAAAFTAKTGIEVEQFQGTTGEILARLEAEQSNPIADVVILASWSDGLSMKADGQLVSYIPENADKVVDGWIDEDSMLSGRSDVQCENRTNLSDIPQIPTDWEKMMEVASDTAAKLNSLCK